jgi:arylsulfatase A-like enzyme
VLIYADDLGWGDVGFNGRTSWATPHLDRLAAQGTVFRRWYTAAVVCAPSRAALLTGRHGIHTGVTSNRQDLPREALTLAEALRPLGYVTGLIGKWHHGSDKGEAEYVHPLDQGFDEFFGFTDGKHAQQKFPGQLWQARELAR